MLCKQYASLKALNFEKVIKKKKQNFKLGCEESHHTDFHTLYKLHQSIYVGSDHESGTEMKRKK